MTKAQRKRFDNMLERVLAGLPEPIASLLEEVPLIVMDRPTPEVLGDVASGDEEEDELVCGLHTGVSLTERSIDDPAAPPTDIHLFREGIVELAGGWDDPDVIEEEIRVTLLHEIGHHFGLQEDDLADLGYD